MQLNTGFWGKIFYKSATFFKENSALADIFYRYEEHLIFLKVHISSPLLIFSNYPPASEASKGVY